MPIKFRCNYCRQFLGISRAQAGGIVDCPTCGRSIRVPMLDGTLQPLPEPELNLQDTHLARALEELAKLGGAEGELENVPVSVRETFEEEPENEIPQPIPEPIPIEVPLPPTPVSVNPPLTDDDVPDATVNETISGRSEDKLLAAQNLIAELALLPPPPSATAQAQPTPEEMARGHQPRTVRRSIPGTAMVIVLAFLAGMLFERFVKVLETWRAGPAVSTGEVTDAQANEAATLVTGRITYKSADGSSQPDQGARLIAFPLQREGEAKLPVTGFRPVDSDIDARIAAAALKALGGGFATADDGGLFHLDLPAGSYQLLVLSHFQAGGDTQAIDPGVRKFLALYFDKPEELLGRVKYDFSPLRVKGTGDVRDHAF